MRGFPLRGLQYSVSRVSSPVNFGVFPFEPITYNIHSVQLRQVSNRVLRAHKAEGAVAAKKTPPLFPGDVRYFQRKKFSRKITC